MAGDESGTARDDRAAGRREERRGPNPAGDIRLKAPSGVVIDYSLPLHETIHSSWRKGELQRVDDEDMLWEGDQYDVSGVYGRQRADRDEDGAGTADEGGDAEGEDGTDPEGGSMVAGQFERADGINGHTGPLTAGVATSGTQEPVRPVPDAPKRAWADYAVAIGACDAAGAARMNRADLIALSTPPELDPLNPEA